MGAYVIQEAYARLKQLYRARQKRGASMTPLRCIIKKESLVIEVGLDVLKFATENHPDLYEDELDKGRYIVTDVAIFTQAVKDELHKEEEDGSTPISRLLDTAILDAISNGAEGVEELEIPAKEPA